jgi:ArsR family transcriptional regulator, zinc-responsive transcriptional repressor
MLECAVAVGDANLEQLSSLFRLLSERTRLAIVMQLAQGERNVSTLCEELGLPQPTVSHHLGLLRMHHLVSNRRNGKQVYYGLRLLPKSAENLLEFVVQNLWVSVSARPLGGAVP